MPEPTALVVCPNCSEETRVDEEFSEQVCEHCHETFEWDGWAEWQD